MKKLALLFGLLIVIFSCDRHDKNELVSQTSTEKRLLTDAQIKLIGQKHNEYLEKAFALNKWSKKSDLQEFENNYKKIIIKDVDTEVLNKKNAINNIDENYNLIKNNLNDKHNIVYFERVIKFLSYMNEEQNVENISNYLDSVRLEFDNKDISSQRDYETFFVFIEVLKSSARFWLSENMGGEGHYIRYKKMEYKGKYIEDGRWRPCLRDVMEADGMSAAAGFTISAAAAALSGPVAPITFIGSIAAESGIASAWAYYRSNNC